MTSLPEGFIPHEGGPCPKHLLRVGVDVLHEDQSISSGELGWFWEFGGDEPPFLKSCWSGEAQPSHSRIIAYRIADKGQDR